MTAFNSLANSLPASGRRALLKQELVRLVTSPLFLIMLALKVGASACFASGFLADYFLPFIDRFVTSGGADPYQAAVNLQLPEAFPYPALMLYVFALPQAALGWMAPTLFVGVTPLTLLLFRLPLLLADFLVFVILVSWLRRNAGKVLLFYWCSPVLFYISYVHGQLDAVPIAFLFLALWATFHERWLTGAFFLGLAVAAKTNILLVLPFYFIYLLLRKVSPGRILASVATIVVVFVLINLPYLFSPAFQSMVFQNKEQNKVFDLVVQFGPNFVLYLVPAAYLALFLKCLTYQTLNRDIFLMYIGFAFSVITALVPPMPGWYFWTIPLLSYFYIKHPSGPRIPFLLLNAGYFLFFAVTKTSDYLLVFAPWNAANPASPSLYSWLGQTGIDADLVVNVVLTLLQATMVMNALWIYRIGVGSNVLSKIKYTPYFVGLGGDSGAGKSTVTQLIQNVFSDKESMVIRGDDMHKWERGDSNWATYTHLNPKANHLHIDLSQALALKQGQRIRRHRYDHGQGRFAETQELRARGIVLIEGLHPFYIPKMRELFDLKIFVRPEESLRRFWKVERDSRDRGHRPEDVLRNMESRREDSEKFILPQERYADLVIAFQHEGEWGPDLKLKLELRLSNEVSIDPLLDELNALASLTVAHYFDFERQVLVVQGTVAGAEIARIAFDRIPELDELSFPEPSWAEDLNGVLQLVIAYSMFAKMRTNGE